MGVLWWCGDVLSGFFTKTRVKCNFLFANIWVLRFFLQFWCDKSVTNIKNTHKSAMKDGQKSL